MSATEELRRLLDECGVEYRWDNGTATWHMDGVMYNAWGYDNERLTMSVCHLTPEQAIAATLGAETCKLPETRIDHGSIEYNGVTEWRRCSACGTEVLAYPVHFCPNCGRKVVDE